MLCRLNSRDVEADSESAPAGNVLGAATAASADDQDAFVSDWPPEPSQSDWPADDSEASWTTQSRGLRQFRRQRRRQQPSESVQLPAVAPQPAATQEPHSAQPPQSRAPPGAAGRVLTIRRPPARGGRGGSEERLSVASGPVSGAPSPPAPVSSDSGVAAPQMPNDVRGATFSDQSVAAHDGSQFAGAADGPVRPAQDDQQAAVARQPSAARVDPSSRAQPPAVDGGTRGRAAKGQRRAATLRDQHGYATPAQTSQTHPDPMYRVTLVRGCLTPQVYGMSVCAHWMVVSMYVVGFRRDATVLGGGQGISGG